MDARKAAKRAERIALAVVMGTASVNDVSEELALANREKEVARSAESLRAYRHGATVWTWPATAPWSGF